MLGNPKYKKDDLVKFKITYHDGKEYELEGKVEIIDRYGTFEQNEEVSYDILVEKVPWNGEPCLIKHIVESKLEK